MANYNPPAPSALRRLSPTKRGMLRAKKLPGRKKQARKKCLRCGSATCRC